MCVTESWSDLFLPDIVRKKEPTAGSLANKKLTMGPMTSALPAILEPDKDRALLPGNAEVKD